MLFLDGRMEQLFSRSEKSIGIHMLFGVSRDPPIPLETLFGFGFGSWVSHLMVPELEQRSATVHPCEPAAARVARRKFFGVVFYILCILCKKVKS